MLRKAVEMESWIGPSEMGRRIIAFDWANHPLGPTDSWPQSLKIALQIMLNSRYAMWMGWGEPFYFFCNDAYLPTVGIKDQWVLGASARQVWAEIWPDIGPRAESVVRSGRATWDESLLLFLERRGFTEETYHTFSYSPIPDDTAAVGGMLCVVTEDTERVIGERRLAILRELGADLTGIKSEKQLFDAIPRRLAAYEKDLPFSLAYVFDADGRHARLVCSHGIQVGDAVIPSIIEVEGEPCAWPARQILSAPAPITIEDLSARMRQLAAGPWPKPPHQAVVVPISHQGHEQPAGFLVAGISSYRPLDSDYLGFVQLVAAQIAAGLASARAYEEERKRVEALAELDRAKTAFFSNVSHEFRTPLTLMLGPLEDMLTGNGTPLADEHRESLNTAHRNCLRLAKLVNTLLDFSRIEAGRLQAVYQPVDLAQYTADLASSFRSACERAGIQLLVHCAPLPETTYVDREMWEKIVLNLISNAFKFTLAGEIEVSLSQLNGNIALSVRDTGVGIPEHALPHLFERFYRVDGMQGRTHEGTGIGLALVRELVRLHGGDVAVESAPDKGSIFTVTIPRGSAHLPDEHIDRSLPLSHSVSVIGAAPFVEEALGWLPEGSTPEVDRARTDLVSWLLQSTGKERVSTSKPRILLADDNKDMRDYATRLLRDAFDVDAVSNGEAALASARAHHPDLIVADVMMPRLDGLQLLRALRADSDTRTIPVILLSARAGQEARIDGLESGADDYLIKPFSARELRARIESLLALSHVRRESNIALQQSAAERQKFVSLVENSRDFVGMANLDQNLIYVNPAGRALVGLESEKDVGETTICDYLPAAMQELFAITIIPTVMKQGRWEGEVVFQHLQSGALLPVYQTVFLIRDPDRRGAACLATVARDVSAQKQAESELRAREERYRALVYALPAAVYTCDAEGRITLYNDAAVALWGRKPEVGKDAWCGSVRIYRPDGAPLPLDQCPMAVALKHGRAIKGAEIVIERPDGTRRHALAHPQPLLDSAGTVAGAINMLVDITERKEAENALRASEEYLRLATQTGTIGVWDWDLDHNRVAWSESLYPIHGLKPGDFGGTVEAFAQLVHPDDRPVVSSSIRAALEDGVPFELEFRIVRPNGEQVWIFTNAKVLRDNGRATRMIGATVDISERKRSENALRDSEARIQQLVALMPAAIYTCDPAGLITYFNRRAAELWGREPRLRDDTETFTGAYRLWQADGILISPDETPMSAAVRRGQSIRDAELIVERPDGTSVVISANIEPLYDHTGRYNGAISVFQDISARKFAERELQQRNQTIQLLSETLAQLLRANDPGSIVNNLFAKVAAHVGADSYIHYMVADGRTLELQSHAGFTDETAEAIARLEWGQAPCGTVAQTHRAITLNNIQDSGDEAAALVRSLGLQTYTCNPLMVGDHLFGTLAFASRSRKFFNEDELDFLRIVSQYTAIVLDRLRAAEALRGNEERLRRQAEELEQQLIASGRLVSLGEITASMAHEFNNPLGIILGFVEDLLSSAPPSDPNHRPLQIIDDEARRCKRIIQDLMDYSRPRSTNLSATNVSQIIRKTLGLVENRLYKQKIKHTTDIAPALPNVHADYQQLEQVLVNFYLNAIDAMPHGGELTVSAAVRDLDGDACLWISVSDTGIGIEEDALGRIFQPFYTAKKTRGLGLGLPICERIVKNHGGRIEVESTVGRGTKFRIVLPSFQIMR